MKTVKKTNRGNNPGKKTNRNLIIAGAALVVLVIAFFAIKGTFSGGNSSTLTAAGELKILKSEVSEKAKFYPLKIDGTKMEVVAVKASDGTVRTAFNTCQVCFDSGRGYYVQEGDELVCQNCGNRFQIDQVEKIKGGCNPVPILDQDKTDDGTNIVISNDFLSKNKDLFLKWKTR